MKTARYGLTGYPLTHSFSPAYFAEKFKKEGIDATYELFAISSIEQLPALLKSNPDIAGLNVTIPYKQSVIPYLDELSDEAKAIGAVNCISIKDGYKIGFNTDAIGFEQSLPPLLQPHHTEALVLGTGGSSKAICYVLDKLSIPYTLVSRKAGEGRIVYDDLTSRIVQKNRLIINTTPVGMHPDTDNAPPILYDALTPQHLLYDLIYNPEETMFLRQGKEHGATIKNGMKMLHLQAEASWKIWQRH